MLTLSVAEIKQLLERLWRVDGVNYCILLTDFGENVGYPEAEARRYDLLSSLFEGVFTAEEENGKRVGIGELDILVADHVMGRVFSKKIKGGILSVVADKKSQMGVIMYMMNQIAKIVDEKELVQSLVKKPSRGEVQDALGLLQQFQSKLR